MGVSLQRPPANRQTKVSKQRNGARRAGAVIECVSCVNFTTFHSPLTAAALTQLLFSAGRVNKSRRGVATPLSQLVVIVVTSMMRMCVMFLGFIADVKYLCRLLQNVLRIVSLEKCFARTSFVFRR